MAAPARRLEPVRRPAHPGIRVSPARTRPAGARSGANAAAAAARAAGKPARTIKAAPPRPQLRVVPPRVRRRRAGAIAVVVCAVTFLVMLGLTVFQARIAADQMRIEQVDRQIRDAKADYTRLRLMVAEAQTPVAAAERAKANGLIPPPKGIEAYVTPSIEQVIAVARSGAASEPGATVDNAATAAPLDGTTDTSQGERAMSTVIERPPRGPRPTTKKSAPGPTGSRPSAAPRRAGAAGSTRIDRPRPPARRRAARRPNPSLWRAGRPKVRVMVLFSVCTTMLLITVGRVAMLQTVDRETYAGFGQQQRLDRLVLTAERGTILDRNLQELAISVPQTTIWADPRLVSDPVGTANALGQVLGYNATEIERLRAALSAEKSQFTYVKRQVDDATAGSVKDLKLDGVFLQVEPKRFTPSGEVARSIVGATDPDGKGTAGLELEYDQQLTGTPGELVRERDRDGRTIPQGHHEVVAAKPGTGIVTTIDQTLQYRVEQLLLNHAKALGATGGGMVTVMDSKTGDLLALASVELDKDTGELIVTSKNRPLLDTFEAGSVMKIVPASAALDTGASELATVWELPASIASADDEIHNAEAHMGGQTLTFQQIIAQSSNIGTVKLAQAVGMTEFEKYLHAFGFGQKSAIDFPNESSGMLPPSSKWYGSQRDTIAYGQGVGVTQVQMTAAMNTIAQKGTYVAPRLVSATVAPDGTTTPVSTSATRQVLQPASAEGMTQVLEAVVCSKEGTVGSHREKYLNLPGYRVAGKTGTGYKAQNKGYLIGYDQKTGKKKIDNYKDENGEYHYIASFAGFVPAENPELTISVTIDEPPFGPNRFGASAAAPLFAQVAGEALRMLAVPPSAGGECPSATP